MSCFISPSIFVEQRLTKFETQARLSAASAMSQSTWSKLENGLAEGVRLEVLAGSRPLFTSTSFCGHAGTRPASIDIRRSADSGDTMTPTSFAPR